jgi:hypothetical protein
LKDQWLGSNVDLDLLSQRVKQFFDETQFETTLERMSNGYKIGAVTKKTLNVQLRITVKVLGQPNDFSVEFMPKRKTRGFSPSMIIGYITSLFGGGIFLLSDAKLQEALDKLEQMFWNHVDKHVAELTNAVTTTII